MSEVLTCPICDSTNVEMVHWPHKINSEPYCTACCVGFNLRDWQRLSDASALLRAVEVLDAQPYIYARAFEGFDVIDIRTIDGARSLASALIALAGRHTNEPA